MSSIIIKKCKAKRNSMNVTTLVSKQDVLLLGFAFVNNQDLASGANNVYTTCTTMITHFHISLPDKNDNLYTVTRDEPTSLHKSLGVQVALDS